MESIKDIYVIGYGPSSSHTMGPAFAVEYILKKYHEIKKVKVTLFGSLALTGKGHLTDHIISKKLGNINHEIIFDYKTKTEHPNTIIFEIFTNDDVFKEEIISAGGGTILTQNSNNKKADAYKYNKMSDILEFCNKNNLSFKDYILENESDDILDYIGKVYKTMKQCTESGLNKEGLLPGTLKITRKAKFMFEKALSNEKFTKKDELLIMATAYACSEENASGNIVVTAPTCGSCGVIPAIIKYLELNNIEEEKIIESLLVAGLVGKIVKTNASVSGAVCGCQAEVGVACAMGAAMIMNAFNFSNEKIAQASEIALEHSLGLTCDPIKGYVQIPCIERNAIFALKAINSASLASIIEKHHSKIDFDSIVTTMYETGIDLKRGYRETSEKGMSKINI